MPVILPKNGTEPWLSSTDPEIDPQIDAAVQITSVSPKNEQAILQRTGLHRAADCASVTERAGAARLLNRGHRHLDRGRGV
jgi:hypothetical protein